MRPSTKSPQREDFIKSTFGVDRVAAIESNHCVPAPVGCGEPITGFRDEKSAQEYTISGLCQNCQDTIW